MTLDSRLSPHFTLREMVRTSHRRLAEENAAVPDALLAAARALCRELLEPVRANFGAPVFIHSGYRCPALNEAVGGVPTSQHIGFEAADFHVHGVSLPTVFDWIRLESGLAYGQVILEGWQAGKPSWIHLSLGEPWRPRDHSRQALAVTAPVVVVG